MGKVVGIDLGTTNSVIAHVEAGEPTIIPNAEGDRTTPSVVAFSKDGERLVGKLAKRQAITNPDRTILSIKREMGTSHRQTIDDKELTPQEISAMILRKLKQDAEEFLGDTVDKAVVTVPAYFTDSQRQATKDAGKIAGLEVLRIINEPTAAALAYGLDESDDQTVLVFDLGGGTFDVSILELSEGTFQVRATSGNNRLGGDDFDNRIVDWIADEFKREYGVDLKKDRMSLQRLREAAEAAKVELSSKVTTQINLPFISAGTEGPLHLDVTLSRARFEDLTRDLVEKTMEPTRQAMKDADLKPEEIDKILLVGGSTRIPAVQNAIKDYLGKGPYKGINPDEVVALGAAIQAGIIGGEVKDVLLLDVTPLSLGIETLGGVFTRIIERNTTIPTKNSQVFSTAADNQTSVDIHVLQGERAMAADNKSLGRFSLVGIPPAPRGIPKIDVTFDIDVNGIVNVSAKDQATGKEQKITIKASEGLSDDEIDQMVKDADQMSDEDKEKKEAAELRNQAETMVYTVEKSMKELGDKVPQDVKDKVSAAIDKVNKAIEGSVDELKAAVAELEQEAAEVGKIAYEQAQAEQAAQAEQGDGEGSGEDDGPIVDGDYDVKK